MKLLINNILESKNMKYPTSMEYSGQLEYEIHTEPPTPSPS